MNGFAARARGAVRAVVDRLPEGLGARLRPTAYRYDPRELPPVSTVPPARRRVLIGAANYAGQASLLARAIDRLPETAARNLHVVPSGSVFGFPADTALSSDLLRLAAPWQRRELAAITRGFTHVIVESGRPMLGPLFDYDVRREIAAFRDAGLRIAHFAHGTDLRLPSRHATIDEWSPLTAAEWPDADLAERGATAFRRLIAETGFPVFVPTPDLLLDHPEAHWAPLVVDIDRWATDAPALQRARLVVVHAPTSRLIKGTDMIEPVLRELDAEGVIEYRRLEGLPADEMPARFAAADVVLDQFRMGIYSSVAVEAMTAGRLVMAHLHAHTIDTIREQTGLEAPIITATPATLGDRLREVAADRARGAELAARGPGFARAVHDGSRSASVVEDAFLKTPE